MTDWHETLKTMLAVAMWFVVFYLISLPTPPKPTYEVDVECENCGYSGKHKVDKGTSVGWCGCPQCQCYRLKKKV
jgi:hypothetical protein